MVFGELLGNLPDDCEEFGEVLRQIREDKDLTLEEAADRLFMTVATLSRWETQAPPKELQFVEVRSITERLACTEEEKFRLLQAFICSVLKSRGVIPK